MCLIVRQSQKAIVNRLREVYHRPASVPLTESGAFFQLEVALLKDHAMITPRYDRTEFVQTWLSTRKRGAPLKENMAAALVMLTNWRKRPTVC